MKESLIVEGGGPLVMDLPFSDKEYGCRLEAVRRLMERRGLDALLSFTPENLYYLTGHDTPGYYYLQACVVTHDQDPVILTRKIESFNTVGRSWKRKVCPFGDTENPVDVLVALLGELGCVGKRIGIESSAWFISSAQYLDLTHQLERTNSVLVDATGLVEELRMIKSEEELVYIREGAKICSTAMQTAFDNSHAGANENDIASATVAKLIEQGGEYAGLPPFISTGPRTTLVHSTWAGRSLQEGDVLAYELPGVRARYCGALYRTGVVGKPSAEIQLGCDMLIELLNELLSAIVPGKPINDVHQVCLDVYKRYGFPSSRRSAYGLGINYPPDWGEGHIISFTEKETRLLQPGMVFHVGSGLYEYPKYQLAFTESVIVTEKGCEVITDFPRELQVC